MLTYVFLTLGGLLLGATVYRYDMHEREPWWMLVLAMLGGALLMFGAFEMESLLERLLIRGGLDFNASFNKALLAASLEESAKLAVPVAVLLMMRRHFNDPMDGLIYGSLAGLGAALFESVWWQWYAPPAVDASAIEVAGPSAVRFLMHTLWGGIDGYALGLIVMKKPWRSALARCVGLVMLMHFAWDYLVGFAEDQTHWRKLVAAGLIGASVVWYGMLVVRTSKWSRAMHAPQSKQRLAGKIIRMLLTRRIR